MSLSSQNRSLDPIGVISAHDNQAAGATASLAKIVDNDANLLVAEIILLNQIRNAENIGNRDPIRWIGRKDIIVKNLDPLVPP